VPWKFFKKLKDIIPPFSYGILKPCRRCVYQNTWEPILIYSFDRGPRIIVNLEGKTYVRKGECLGFQKCFHCLEKVKKKPLELPCEWIEI